MTSSHSSTLRGHSVSSRVLVPPPAQNLDDAVLLCVPHTPLDSREDASLSAELSTLRGDELCYAPAGADPSGVNIEPIVVPVMIKVRRRTDEGGGDDPKGIAALSDLLKRRVRFDLLFEEGDAAAERIARMSGGCVQHALHILRSAINEHDVPPVTGASVDRSAAMLRANLERALPGPWVPILRRIAATNQLPDGYGEKAKRDLLLNLFVLEYQSDGPDLWYAVHPLVEQCRKYREHG